MQKTAEVRLKRFKREVNNGKMANKNSYRSVSDDSYFTNCLVKEVVKP